MEKRFAYKIACAWFWLGDKAEKPIGCYNSDLIDGIFYYIYNHCMTKSVELSDKYDLGIWYDA